MSDNNDLFQHITDKLTAAVECRESEILAHDGTEITIFAGPSDIKVTDLQSFADKYASAPRHRAGKLRAFDLDSFAALTLRDYDAGTVVFVDVSGAGVAFETCLDYHMPIANLTPRTNQRAQRETIEYTPALSKEWLNWTGQAGETMSQTAFAEWIEDHLPDIADPRHLLASPDCTAVKLGEVYGFRRENLWGYADPAKLADVSRGLEIREGAVLKNAVRLESGEVSMVYHTEHTGADGQRLNVPTRFLLSISVFEREAEYFVPVKLAYRKAGGALTWSFELFRPERFRDDAIKGLVSTLGMKLTPAAPTNALATAGLPPVIAPVVPIQLAKRVS
jgi:uncharacterized protein YfdQ (DUF2303 family)